MGKQITWWCVNAPPTDICNITELEMSPQFWRKRIFFKVGGRTSARQEGGERKRDGEGDDDSRRVKERRRKGMEGEELEREE